MPSFNADSASSAASSSMNSYGRLSSSSTDDVTGLAALRAAQNLLDHAQNRFDLPPASTNTKSLLNAPLGSGGIFGGGSNVLGGRSDGFDVLQSRRQQDDMARGNGGMMRGRPDDLDMLSNRRHQEDLARILANVQSKTGGPPTPIRDMPQSSSFMDPGIFRGGTAMTTSCQPPMTSTFKRPFPFETDSSSYSR